MSQILFKIHLHLILGEVFLLHELMLCLLNQFLLHFWGQEAWRRSHHVVSLFHSSLSVLFLLSENILI